jgi:16S rRNA (cytidine1402-2'-O)-methyltransferase
VALWIVATPIGTVADLSPRAREVLGHVTCIAAEDTRTTRSLLQLAGVTWLEGRAPQLVALHAHNEDTASAALAERARSEDVALVSDAGTPGISDPGRALVEAAHRVGARVISVPGPSALAAALAASGFPAAPSSFLGFPPRKGRASWAAATVARPETLVLYEAGNRTADLLAALAAVAPEREAAMCREISKKFEEILRRPLAELAAEVGAREEVRGEVVVVLGPGAVTAAPSDEAAPLAAGAGVKDAAAALAERWNVPRRDVYEGLLALERTLRRG